MQQAKAYARPEPQLRTSLAHNVAEIRAAQRLRYQVFACEMGARVPGSEQGIDCDLYDAYCDHLLVTHAGSGEVVGTYRLLSGPAAQRAGGFYSDSEFDLASLDPIRGDIVEAGRACVHPDYRNGAVLALLWAGILEYVMQGGFRYLAGCASLSLADGGGHAAAVYRALAAERYAPAAFRVAPHRPWTPPREVALRADCALPALIKGYRNLGAYVCGEPAWDADFNTADLFLLLSVGDLDSRYLRRFGRCS